MKTRKKKKPEATAVNAVVALLRGARKPKKESMRMRERFSMREAVVSVKPMPTSNQSSVLEGHVVDVVLITEGLGNRRNMNYYGPEAIESAPPVFEGKPCFLDHPSESEERDIPERRVRQKCGYFKNCRVESDNNVRACVGELHFDLSEDGTQAFQKARTALHYKDEFPDGASEYVGLSINADGDYEERTVEWQGETLQVNYVTQFRDAMSCDIVTSPARGGRFLALVESAAGAMWRSNLAAKPTQEVGNMKKGLEESLKAAQTALDEAEKAKDVDAMKKKVAEANKSFKAFVSEAAKASYQNEDESESEDENESESESEDMAGEDETESSGDSHTVTTHKVVKKTGKAAVPKEDEDEADDAGDDDDAMESRRIAIASMAKESGLDLPKTIMDRLAKGSIKEAKRELAEFKWMQESTMKKAIKSIRVPGVTFAKVTESVRESDGSESDFLATCVK